VHETELLAVAFKAVSFALSLLQFKWSQTDNQSAIFSRPY